jgi:hypothetical protein
VTGTVAAAAMAMEHSVATNTPSCLGCEANRSERRAADARRPFFQALQAYMSIASEDDLWHVFRVTGPWNDRLVATLAMGTLTLSCSRFESKKEVVADPAFRVALVVVGEGHLGIAGAQILKDKTVVGTTSEKGVALLSFHGQEGDTVALKIQCPAAYASPKKAVVVGLRHLDTGSPAPRFEAECIRQLHSVVVGLRAENGANLPIVRLGQVIGKTDDAGMAHLLLETSPDEQITLRLDTSSNDTLRPENPNLTFMSKDADDFVLLEQKFTVKKKIVPHYVKPRPQRI